VILEELTAFTESFCESFNICDETLYWDTTPSNKTKTIAIFYNRLTDTRTGASVAQRDSWYPDGHQKRGSTVLADAMLRNFCFLNY
jgi:hypothetical protein